MQYPTNLTISTIAFSYFDVHAIMMNRAPLAQLSRILFTPATGKTLSFL